MSGGKVPPFKAGDVIRSVRGTTVTVRSCSLMSNNEFSTAVELESGSVTTISHHELTEWTLLHSGHAATFIAGFLAPIRNDDPLRVRRQRAMRNLEMLVELRAAIDAQLNENVAQARHRGAQHYDYGAPSWADIGAKLGVTKQAAQAKYGKATMQQ